MLFNTFVSPQALPPQVGAFWHGKKNTFPPASAVHAHTALAWLARMVIMAFLWAACIGPLTAWPRAATAAGMRSPWRVLKPAHFKHYVTTFNQNDWQLYPSLIGNAQAWKFLRANIPLLDCPDKTLEQMYYFRWWTYRKHIKKTPGGFVITEFLPPVPWAGPYNTIDCAAAPQIYEGRWLNNRAYIKSYINFWLKRGGRLRRYSFWIANAVWNFYKVTGARHFAVGLLPDLIRNYRAWAKRQQSPHGLFWQVDDRDGMEMSAGGSGYRPTINSYLYGEARAIFHLATLAGQPAIAQLFAKKASTLKALVQNKLWNPDAHFFETRQRTATDQMGAFVHVREEIGYTPWYFNLPTARGGYSMAWQQLMNPHGFWAPYGPTTCEQRSSKFKISYKGHECQWDGPSWPYATSITLTAMANLLDHYHQTLVTRADYLKLLRIYARSQHIRVGPWYKGHAPNGAVIPWIDEDLNPYTGDWIAHTLLLQRQQKPYSRGKDYNHSTFCDLIITGLIGLRPQAGSGVVVKPLVPSGLWNYFCLDAIHYHGRVLTILYDRSGRRYGRGRGLRIFANGRLIAHRRTLGPLRGTLPPRK